MDRQTPHDGIGCTIASSSKNGKLLSDELMEWMDGLDRRIIALGSWH